MGPHSLSDLCYWHQYGYLHSSVMVSKLTVHQDFVSIKAVFCFWHCANFANLGILFVRANPVFVHLAFLFFFFSLFSNVLY